jgi:hypothetical protein
LRLGCLLISMALLWWGQAARREIVLGLTLLGARDLADGLALVAPANRFLLLLRGELEPSAETFAVRLGAGPALAGANADKFALELGQST